MSYKLLTGHKNKSKRLPSLMKKNGTRIYDKCNMYSIDYSSLAGLPFETAKAHALQEIEANNGANKSCTSRVFAESAQSVVTKWDLVCDRLAIYSTTQSAIQAGMLIGSLGWGFLIDKYGRRLIHRICFVSHIICGFLNSVSPTIHIYIILRVAISTFNMGHYMASFVLAMEMCDARQRTMVGNYYVLPWAFGMMLTAGLSSLVSTWYYLQLILTLPVLIMILTIFFLPESPRWLILQARYEEAYVILSSIAMANKKELPKKEIFIDEMKEVHKSLVPSSDSNMDQTFLLKVEKGFKYLIEPITNRSLTKRTFAIYFCWFSVSLVYYGVSLGSTSLSTNPYLYIFLGGLLEVPSYLVLWPAMAYFGRRNCLGICYFICAGSILSVMFMIIYAEDGAYSVLKTALFLAGKVAITAAFQVDWLYTTELYPTRLRSLALGEASAMARVGSICSPYINDLLIVVSKWGPSALFGILSVISGLVAFLLPETTNKALTEDENTRANELENKNAHSNPAFEK